MIPTTEFYTQEDAQHLNEPTLYFAITWKTGNRNDENASVYV